MATFHFNMTNCLLCLWFLSYNQYYHFTFFIKLFLNIKKIFEGHTLYYILRLLRIFAISLLGYCSILTMYLFQNDNIFLYPQASQQVSFILYFLYIRSACIRDRDVLLFRIFHIRTDQFFL